MKNLAAFLSLCFFPAVSICQNYQADAFILRPSHLMLGDQYFTQNMQGVRSFMESLEKSDKTMHKEMSPIYQKMKEKNSIGIATSTGGILLGSALILGPVMSSGERQSSGTINSASEPNVGLMVVGATLMIASGALFSIHLTKQPTRILEFVNHYNLKSTGEKIIITLHPDLGNMSAPMAGVRLQVRLH